MNVYEIIKSALELNKNTFEKGLKAIGSLQEKVAEKGSEFLETYSLFPEEGKHAVTQWTAAARNNMQLVQVVAERNYEEMENFLSVKK